MTYTFQMMRDNLKRTIDGKEKMFEGLYPNNPKSEMWLDEEETAVRRTTIKFLKSNISELKELLAELEFCLKGENLP